MIWPTPRGTKDVPVAACSNPADISARPEACRPGSTRRRIAGGSAPAVPSVGVASADATVAAASRRRVYPATIVVSISVMLHGATSPRVARLSQLVGVSRRTVARSRDWWRTAFAESRFWQAKRAAFMPPNRPRAPAYVRARALCRGVATFEFQVRAPWRSVCVRPNRSPSPGWREWLKRHARTFGLAIASVSDRAACCKTAYVFFVVGHVNVEILALPGRRGIRQRIGQRSESWNAPGTERHCLF